MPKTKKSISPKKTIKNLTILLGLLSLPEMVKVIVHQTMNHRFNTKSSKMYNNKRRTRAKVINPLLKKKDG